MGEVPPLVLPIHDLRGGDGDRIPTGSLDQGRYAEGDLIQDVIGLPVMVQIEQRRMVNDSFQDGVRKPYADGDAEWQFC
jgi:hypothetical protein